MGGAPEWVEHLSGWSPVHWSSGWHGNRFCVAPHSCPCADLPTILQTTAWKTSSGSSPSGSPGEDTSCLVPTWLVRTHCAAWTSSPPVLCCGGRGRGHGWLPGAESIAGPPATHVSTTKGSQSSLSSNEGKQISN